jgi:DNA gyrase subunit A
MENNEEKNVDNLDIDKLLNTNIVDEMNNSFLEYSMSVIVARALPDLRDGLKPVHRRILYSMYESGYTPDKTFKKSAKTVGEVMGNYHPHGDSAIYDSLVRMAQPFSYRHTLIEGHGNFGSMDGDGAAAMRYTEARLSKLSMELLRDINKNTVDFVDNFDSTRKEPQVIPSRFPNILVNGTMGIAVGMATNIPPHNLGEVIDGCVAFIDNPEITTLELMNYIKGPDFPTGAVILGNSGIVKAYETGKGSVTIRSKVEIEESNGKSKLIITELPYQTNKRDLQQRIGELVRDKVIDGIADLHEETNLENGIKIVVTLKKEANANVVLNNLYKHTALQTTFGINFLMLDQNQPRLLGLKHIISKYIDFQKEVIIRRTKFELDRAEKRVHILEGYKIALDHIDEVIKIIRGSESDVIAKTTLIERFGLSDIQADSILEMKLRRLTGLERGKIEAELEELLTLINELRAILGSEEKVLAIIKEEMLEIKAKYADERRTKIDMTAIEYIEDESLIPEEDVIITITNKNYIKRMTTDTYKTQNRGGVGIKGMSTNDEDFVEQIINLSTHDFLLFFSNKGRVYRLKGYEVPEYSRTSKGLPLVNLIQIDKDETISAVVKIEKDNDFKYLIFGTKNGVIKRTMISEFDNIRQSGKVAITLRENDELNSVKKSTGSNHILMCSSEGRMVRFKEDEVRVMGRTAAGVRGINLNDDVCVGTEVTTDDMNVLVVTEKGYGKKTPVLDYRETKRGSKGVKTLNITDKNGKIVGFKSVEDDKDLMIITNNGVIIRLGIENISRMGRVTQGVKLINLKDDNLVASVSVINKSIQEENLDNEEETEVIND